MSQIARIGILVYCCTLGSGIYISAQHFENLDFSQTCDLTETGLCHWDLSWGPQDAVEINRRTMTLVGASEQSVVFVEQMALYPTSGQMSTITISANMSCDQVHGKGAGLNIGLYDQGGQLISTKDMGGFYSLDWMNGTTKRERKSVSIVVPGETRTVKIGAILYGKGRATFENYDVQIKEITNRSPGQNAKRYLSDACDQIMSNSLVRDSIDIEHIKQTAFSIAADAKTHADCHLAVTYLLESLRPFGDHHSFFTSSEEYEQWKTDGSEVVEIEFSEIDNHHRCGLIKVPPFHGGNQEQILAFADHLQNGIQDLSHEGVVGWIVDLRENTGGNMAPMVAGLGPLFSGQKLGALIDVDGKPDAWYYSDGRYHWDTDTGWTVSNPVLLKRQLPIAVLTSAQTGSSGEAVVVSFKGNANTRFIGQPTWGLTTGNGEFELLDGSWIFLASTVYADRNGKIYEGRISPDVLIEEDLDDNESDPVLHAAIKWIKEQN